MSRKTPAGRAAQDAGTRYSAALASLTGTTEDEQLMAYLCEYVIYRAAPAFNPRLVWEGAQAAGVTHRQLKKMAQDRQWREIEAYMWAAMERQ
jgi:hypothetical protein